MPTEIRLTDKQWTDLRGLLLTDDSEHAAVLVCHTLRGAPGVLVTRRVVELTEHDMLDAGPLHLSISPVAMARITKQARSEGATVVLCHSHPWAGPVHASTIDLETEEELCGRVLAGRLHAPVGALILGTESFDGRLWLGRGSTSLDRIRVVGATIELHPEPRAVAADDRVARQVLAWGSVGQTRFRSARVAVIGCGGTGSHVITQLAHLGVGGLLLIDPDHVEVTNLSRLIGARPADVGALKTDVLARAARAISPTLTVETIPLSLLDIDPAVLAECDVIVCATDGHGSRALLTELAQQYVLPVVDLGVDIVPTQTQLHVGGQVRVLRPGDGCLHCADMLNPRLVWEEYLTEAERDLERKRGYISGVQAPAPAVIALNGVVASLACLEVCQLLAGFLGEARDRLLFRAHRRALTTAGISRHESCYVCGLEGLLGLGDSRVLPVRRPPAAGEA